MPMSRPRRGRVEDVMPLPFRIKLRPVTARSGNGFIGERKRFDQRLPIGIRNADPPGPSVGMLPDCPGLTELHQHVFETTRAETVGYTIGNEPLGYPVQG